MSQKEQIRRKMKDRKFNGKNRRSKRICDFSWRKYKR